MLTSSSLKYTVTLVKRFVHDPLFLCSAKIVRRMKIGAYVIASSSSEYNNNYSPAQIDQSRV